MDDKKNCKKKCEVNKICNTSTRRCVKKTGLAGRRALLRNKGISNDSKKTLKQKKIDVNKYINDEYWKYLYRHVFKKKQQKGCPGKILNTKTGRCVNKHGSSGLSELTRIYKETKQSSARELTETEKTEYVNIYINDDRWETIYKDVITKFNAYHRLIIRFRKKQKESKTREKKQKESKTREKKQKESRTREKKKPARIPDSELTMDWEEFEEIPVDTFLKKNKKSVVFYNTEKKEYSAIAEGQLKNADIHFECNSVQEYAHVPLESDLKNKRLEFYPFTMKNGFKVMIQHNLAERRAFKSFMRNSRTRVFKLKHIVTRPLILVSKNVLKGTDPNRLVSANHCQGQDTYKIYELEPIEKYNKQYGALK